MEKLDLNIAGFIDHTLLKPDVTKEQITGLCSQAKDFGFYSVCVSPRWVPLAVKLLYASDVKVCSVVSFPFGANSTKTKVSEAKNVILDGADEVDMVADIASIIENDSKYLLNQLTAIVKVCHSMRPAVALKVIIESASLTDHQIIFACQVLQKAGVDFIKTSTGLHSAGGATVHAVQLIKENAPGCKVKAAGGIKTFDQAIEMIEAGADRIGTSSAVKIMQDFLASR